MPIYKNLTQITASLLSLAKPHFPDDIHHKVDLIPHISLLALTSTMRLRDPQQTTQKQFTPSTSDVVHAGGQYRVGKLLSTGGSGELNSDLNLRHFSKLVRECLSRKRHYDGV